VAHVARSGSSRRDARASTEPSTPVLNPRAPIRSATAPPHAAQPDADAVRWFLSDRSRPAPRSFGIRRQALCSCTPRWLAHCRPLAACCSRCESRRAASRSAQRSFFARLQAPPALTTPLGMRACVDCSRSRSSCLPEVRAQKGAAEGRRWRVRSIPTEQAGARAGVQPPLSHTLLAPLPRPPPPRCPRALAAAGDPRKSPPWRARPATAVVPRICPLVARRSSLLPRC